MEVVLNIKNEVILLTAVNNKSSKDIIQLLLDYGADLEKVTKQGNTVLTLAYKCNPDVVEQLEKANNKTIHDKPKTKDIEF